MLKVALERDKRKREGLSTFKVQMGRYPYQIPTLFANHATNYENVARTYFLKLRMHQIIVHENNNLNIKLQIDV